MKIRSLVIAVMLLTLAAWAQAASVVTPSVYSASRSGSVLVLKLACTAHTDGTFDSRAITIDDINPHTYAMDGPFWHMGYRISNAWAVNPASGYPTVAAVVTVTDATGQQLIGATVGDTLTLSTSASGVAYLLIDRSGSQRLVTSALTVAIGDTGTAANTVDIYLVLERF